MGLPPDADDNGVLNEPIELAAPAAAWADWYDDEASRLRPAVPGGVVVEHFGSTAVPGLLSKPVVDILIGVGAQRDIAAVAAALADLGYERVGEGGVPQTAFLRRRIDDRAFHARIAVVESEVFRDAILLRDYLRSSSDARRTYAAAKREIYAEGHRRALDYGDAKGLAVEELLKAAKAWRQRAP